MEIAGYHIAAVPLGDGVEIQDFSVAAGLHGLLYRVVGRKTVRGESESPYIEKRSAADVKSSARELFVFL